MALTSNKIFAELVGVERVLGLTLELSDKWNEPHRYYHNQENHLNHILNDIDNINTDDVEYLEKLEIIAWFHDAIYDPKANTNEEHSMSYWVDCIQHDMLDDPRVKEIGDCILDTKSLKPRSDLSVTFLGIDFNQLRNGSFLTLYRNELLILKEFQFVDYEKYKAMRLTFLNTIASKIPALISERVIDDLNKYILTHRPKVGVYAGSFDPFHIGHNNILEQAERMFDKVIIAVGINPDKRSQIDQDKFDAVTEALPYNQVIFCDRFLHNEIIEQEINCDVTLIRGFRSGYDADADLKNIKFMKDAYEKLRVIFIACDSEFDHISSSALRGIAKINQDVINPYLKKRG